MTVSVNPNTTTNLQGNENTVDGLLVRSLARFGVDAAGNHIAGRPWHYDYTPTVDTNVLAAGDIFSDTAILNNVAPANDVPFVLRHVQAIEKQDNAFGFDIWLLSAATSLGTLNAAPSLSDANGENLQDWVSLYSAEWRDLGGFKRWGKSVNIPLVPASGTRNLYCALVVNENAPTLAASSLKLRFWFQSAM